MPKPSITSTPLPQIKPSDLHRFHAALARWYAAHGRRDLPWRTTRDPYEIWVSEVMLQQTQVSTVLARFYFPFIEAFPTIQHLAAAPREKVMKAWEGLGYYRRAGFLHEAAKRAHNGLPEDADGLMSLPGIGRNTAHAILAFAHHQPVAILEANVKRVVARIFAFTNPNEAELWRAAEALLNQHAVFDYNQAMMDIGALVCTPKAPDCKACPANTICKGKAAPEKYPAPKAKKKSPTRRVALIVTEDGAGKLYLEKRSDALLGGLWGFPQIPLTVIASDSVAIQTMVPQAMPAGLPRFARNDAAPIGHITHIYTHFRLEGDVYHQQLAVTKKGERWLTRAEIKALPLSKLDHKILALMDKGHTPPRKSPKSAARRTRD